ncbi:hypothetical protein C7974DRAFT_24232 [Boeremia exigua]|uniref:uncharacterized protein n=1 Tax=Boeremia exigua TaxID=749465 RepID=UPI001E8E3FBD|nr:uncharacterized protein C7974DRAFT_24232 [Boeremia exigua]KAH6644600.1 hypothetical protein C7974DRAFT_24232 [Boeremia exigua]
MPPRKQKAIAPREHVYKPIRPRKSQFVAPPPEPIAKSLTLKLKLNSNAHKIPQSPVPTSPVEDGAKENGFQHGIQSGMNEQGMRRGERQRTKLYQPDMVFGSEMDNLITSSATEGKMDDMDAEHTLVSSPTTVISMHAPARFDSPATIQCTNSPPPRYTGPVSQDVYDILSTLQASTKIQVDLPNIMASDNSDIAKPYTAALLVELYVQCYNNQLWHFCDLVADTWIRALQTANRDTQKSKNVQDHLWRKNVALERAFAEQKKGFKQDVFEFGLDIEDPDMADDVAEIRPQQLRALYAQTGPKCGARLLWADAMALCGKKMEHEIVRQPEAWPAESFFEVMCTSLRMVGRNLTLKIEETYEGAWCRYHEHSKHGQPCYRKEAWMQKEACPEEEEYAGNATETEAIRSTSKSEKRAAAVRGNEHGDAKRVRFDASSAEVEVIDFGDIDAEGESEEDS